LWHRRRPPGPLAGWVCTASRPLPALSAGWWLGQRGFGMAGADRSEQGSAQASQFAPGGSQQRQSQPPSQQQRLLNCCWHFKRMPKPTALLERMADQQPDRWPLRLMLAELRRDSEMTAREAEREVRQLLNIKPRPDRSPATDGLAPIRAGAGRTGPKPAGGRPQGSVQVHSASRARPASQGACRSACCSQTSYNAGGSNRRPISSTGSWPKDHPNSMEPSLASGPAQP